MKAIGKRFYDLVIKLISVKTIPAVIASVPYVVNGGFTNGVIFMVAWALVIGFRYAEKVKGLFGTRPTDDAK